MKKFILFFTLLLFVVQTGSAQCSYTVSASADTSFCDNISVQLNGVVTGTVPSNATYTWSPSAGLNNSTSLNPIATVSSTTTYTFEVASQSTTNLVANGDFESGNTSFTTGYSVGTGGTWGPVSNAGTYLITNNANNAHNNYAACNDHTPNPGVNMMVVNGAITPNTNIWCQTMTVTPNTTYNFEMWATSTVGTGVAPVLQVRFNGLLPSANLNVSTTTCDWQQYTASWNSGASTVLNLCVQDLVLINSGNDFAIDDIALFPVCTESASVTLTSHVTGTTEFEETLCVGDSIMAGGAFQFTNGVYSDTLTSFHGCDSVIIIDVEFKEATKPQLGVDTTLCGNTPITLFTNISAVSYAWSNGSTNDSITVTSTGEYILEITDNNGCSKSDTIQIDYNEYPIVQLGNDTSLCLGESFTLRADQIFSGANYLWQDGSTSSTYPVLEPGGTYSLTVSNGECEDSDEIIVTYEGCQCRVGVPNVFTPNSDGINDNIELKTENGCEFVSYRFQVYTRWGKLVYSTTNLSDNWDGVFNGQILPQDSYVWVLDYELDPRFEEAPVRKSGTVLLIR